MKKTYEIFRSELDSIKEAGTYKDERIITTPQKARIDTTVAKGVLNMCANNYLFRTEKSLEQTAVCIEA